MSESRSEIAHRAGTVVRYSPDPSRHNPRWCREGIAVAGADGVLRDTYWQSGGDAHRLLPVELATIEHLFDLHDYDELDRHSRGSAAVWRTYHPDDRRAVTSQHGLQVRLFVRKGSVPDLGTRIVNAEEKVAEAERAVRSANQQLEWAREDLAALRTPPAGGEA